MDYHEFLIFWAKFVKLREHFQRFVRAYPEVLSKRLDEAAKLKLVGQLRRWVDFPPFWLALHLVLALHPKQARGASLPPAYFHERRTDN